MPSIVMLMALWSSPLTIESRLPPGVRTPGMPVRKSSAFLDCTGRLLIWPTSIVLDTAADCVWTIGDSACTTTVSSTPPTSSVARTEPGVAARSLTSLMTACLKPDRDTVTV